ncbi:MAG TPA: glycosyltransferase family 4 protein [Nakamurella sp.]|jgi:glycosyltransferase involved in cell wall biosynthesis
MRILHVVDNYPPVPGGMERAVQALARAQAALGHDVRVVALATPSLPTATRDGGVRVFRFEGYTRFLRRFSSDPEHQFHPTVPDPQLVRRLEALLRGEPADIVHAHGWIVHSAMAMDRHPGTALVHTLHDYGLTCATKTMIRDQQPGPICPGPSPARCLSCSTGFYGAAKGIALTAGTLIGRRRSGRSGPFPAVDMFLPISRAVADASLDRVSPERIRVVPSFVPDDLMPDPGPRPDFLPDGDFLLFVGQLGPHKGIGTLLAAHRRMDRALPLVVVGSVRPDSPDFAGTDERPVHLFSGLDHETIMRCYAAATVCAVPSQWAEPFGLVAVESMAAGTPVVASDIGGLAEVIGDGCSGALVAPGRPDDLAAALDMVLGEPALRAQVAAQGRRRAADFTASAVLPAVFDAYGAALRHRTGQRERVPA